jgi:hypothetical protein|tara:strand:- start:8 stop:418 length:411 start_codon:yes stop_codon:yes gene_type:complete
MELNIQKLKEGDYEKLLVNWWKDWQWDAPPKNFLPDNGTGGFMVYNKNIPICAGFIYKSNSKVAWVDWIISDKNYKDKESRKEGIIYLIQALTEICKQLGYAYCYALVKHEGLIKTYEDLGYIKADNYNQELIKHL